MNPASNRPMSDTFQFEGDTLRVVCRGRDSGAILSHRARAKWVLQRRLPDGRWKDEMYTLLSNGASVLQAKQQFGF